MVECRPTSNLTTSGELSQDENSVLVSPNLVSPEPEKVTEVVKIPEKTIKAKSKNKPKKIHEPDNNLSKQDEPTKVDENVESSSGDLNEGDGSLEDDEDVIATSRSPSIVVTTHVHNTTSSVCANAKCSSNKVCVEDATFGPGYRCCKKKDCDTSLFIINIGF